jgi:aromatic-L-amino-acid/L-tryptophan decarboxylase
VWLVLQQIGVDGYRECLTHDIRLAGALRRRIGDAPDFELIAAGPLSITCFRYRPERLYEDAARLDELNRLVLAAVQDAGDVFLTGTELAGRFALRACILNFRTEDPDLDTLLHAIRTAGERLVSA